MPLHHDHSLPDFANSLFSTTAEKIGGVVSVGMISSPFWIQQVKPYSDVAALLAPILGCIYLSLQIGFKLYDRGSKED
jgi:hypothetical protein